MQRVYRHFWGALGDEDYEIQSSACPTILWHLGWLFNPSADVIDVTPKWSKNRLIVQWMIWWVIFCRLECTLPTHFFLATLTLSSVFSPQSLWTMGHPLFFLGESHSTQGRWSLGKDYGLIDLEETSATWTDSYLSCAAAWLGKS